MFSILTHYKPKLGISGLYYKSFTIVIYDRNDSMIVEPVL